MSYHAFKVLHLFGVLLLFMSLGGLTALGLAGGWRRDTPGRRLMLASHGIALAIILVAGFGALGRLGLLAGGLPGWAWIKLGIWVLMGVALVALKRLPALVRPMWVVLPLLGGLAAWLAITKPVL